MSEAPATTPLAPGQPEAAPTTPPPTAASAFLRLAGHLRLATAGAVLLLKVSALLAIIILWIAMSDEFVYGQIRGDD